MLEKPSIPEITYQLRLLARNSEQAHQKDICYQSCFLLEFIDNFVKLCESVEAHSKITENPEKTEIPTEVAGMMLDYLQEIRTKYKTIE